MMSENFTHYRQVIPAGLIHKGVKREYSGIFDSLLDFPPLVFRNPDLCLNF